MTASAKVKCTICGSENGHTFHTFRDLHFRTSGQFEYFQCGSCHCLQAVNPSEDYSAYYPATYYSFTADDRTTIASRVKWKIREVRNRYYRTGKGVIGELIHRVLPNSAIEMFHSIHPEKEWKILDVGCGNDALFLQYLDQEGYIDFLGVDPYIPVPERIIGSGKIVRRRLADINDSFNLITFHHSFEHVPDQQETLLKCKELLAPRGTLLLRIPTVTSFAWEHDGEFWANLDAPRHLFLHSQKSIRLLGEHCGLKTNRIVYDSNGFQFWGAALYKRGIPLGGKCSVGVKVLHLMLRLYYSIRMAKRIEQLNASSMGDTIAVFMCTAG
ncbi:MAG: class I SAM-dependent methyltransferase [Chitinispirillaceae bacterium]|nr:class I SAM-dependent methyltransferase [Chitinispirillaceae bacterium]